MMFGEQMVQVIILMLALSLLSLKRFIYIYIYMFCNTLSEDVCNEPSKNFILNAEYFLKKPKVLHYSQQIYKKVFC